jgi:hypothetical protein
MQIEAFELERWQSVWEHKVELNIAESGVLPMAAVELADDPRDLDRILALPLGYPQTNGSEELRARIASLYPGAGPDNVLVTCGGAEANFLSVWALLEPGDEVVVMQPNYGQIAPLAKSFGAVVKPWWLRQELRWQPDPGELAELVTGGTRFIAVCNPNNPTGAVLSAESMRAVVKAASRVGAWILADEVYRGAEFEGDLTPTFWGSYGRVLSTASLSKAFALPGLRTGWVVAPPTMATKLWGYHDYTSISPTVVCERLASLALEPTKRAEILGRTRRILRANFPPLADWAARREEMRALVPPAAGAIAWIPYARSRQLVQDALIQKSVLLCSGEHFGMPGYLRIGFGGHTGELLEALSRIEELLQTP